MYNLPSPTVICIFFLLPTQIIFELEDFYLLNIIRGNSKYI